MQPISPKRLKAIEFFSLSLNNLLLLLGIPLFGWTLFETLFLHWLETLVAAFLVAYLYVIVPLKNSRPGYIWQEEYQRVALKGIGILVYVFIAHFFVLIFISSFEVPSVTQNWGQAFWGLPQLLYQTNMIWISVLLIVAYILPLFLLKRRNIELSVKNLPLQTKIMIYPSQFITNYILFGVVMFTSFYTSNALLLISFLVILKMCIEWWIFRKLTAHY